MEWTIDLTSLFDDNLIYTDKFTILNYSTTLGFCLANLWEATIQTPCACTFACFLVCLSFVWVHEEEVTCGNGERGEKQEAGKQKARELRFVTVCLITLHFQRNIQFQSCQLVGKEWFPSVVFPWILAPRQGSKVYSHFFLGLRKYMLMLGSFCVHTECKDTCEIPDEGKNLGSRKNCQIVCQYQRRSWALLRGFWQQLKTEPELLRRNFSPNTYLLISVGPTTSLQK